MTIDELRLKLDEISTISNAEWLASLDARKIAELEFHNKERNKDRPKQLSQDEYERFYGNKKYYSTVARSSRFVENWIMKNSGGKIFLDYACGNGQQAILAAKHGAALSIGLDISDESILNAKNDAAASNIPNVMFLQADAENTRLPDSCVDVIICSGMLHHLDLTRAFPELSRILKPGGTILAVEALNCNPPRHPVAIATLDASRRLRFGPSSLP